ncbi:DUF5906 domain-containing protein [Burkholderia gladioli]|uniref:DUF5906 domain-containing protein n=1 Tax=Burkholderia gladioli TaxID=28095 RepID=UPI003B9836A0
MTPRPQALDVDVDGIPQSLRDIPRWVVWRHQWKQTRQRWIKLPCNPRGGTAAVDNPATWSTFEDALDAYEFVGGYDGLGFVFTAGDDIVGGDFDKCLDPTTGALTGAVVDALQRIGGYWEKSPSGTGLHFITRAVLAKARKDDAKGIELYNTGRFFTVTGQVFDGRCELSPTQEDLQPFIDAHFPAKVVTAPVHEVLAGPAAVATGGDFYKNVNDAAMKAFGHWVPVLFPEAIPYRGGFRVTSASLGRALEEDISIVADGIKDFGVADMGDAREGGRTPIDLVIEWMKGATPPSAREAARWLCDRMGVTPEALGWTDELLRLASEDDFGVGDVDDAPKGWHDGWYFLAARDRLAKVGEPGTLSITGFNTRFAVQMSANSKGKKEAAFEAVRNGPGFPIAEDVVYAAGQPPVYMFEGRRFVNAYRESSIPPAATNESPGGREAVARVRRHLELLCGEPDTARMVETWIALNVREPGRLIGVALLVKGVQGDGKTIIFSQLMSEIMGRENVGLIANKEMSSDFSGWATGRAVRVVEELKAPGHNRHDMLNSIKPNITNPTVRVVRKGQDGFDALNTTNYACLTNHEDALPLDETDRRWWVIFSPFTDIAQLRALVGDLPTYFDALSKAIAHHGPELRKYFLECPLDVRVHHHMRAPATEGRARMIQAENQLAGGDYLDGYIASGGECGISADIVASSELRRCLLRDMEEGVPHTTKLKRLLESRGYRQCVGTIKWVGAMHRVYVRDSRLVNAAADEVGRQRLRSLLDETVKNNQLAESSDFEVASK